MLMSRRNRKKRLHGSAFPVPFAGVAVAFVALALTYVWLGSRCDRLGQEIKTLETERVELNKKYMNAEFRWASLKSPQSLETALAAHQISMDWPSHEQVVLMTGAVRGRAPQVASTREAPALARVNVQRVSRHE
jgi:hypothetical protein